MSEYAFTPRGGHRAEMHDWISRFSGPGRHGRRGHREHPFGRGFGRGEMGGFGRGRAARGDIRAAILALLAEQPMHGYQIMQELLERSGGAWRVSPGSVYPTLAQLEDEELIQAEQQGGKRVFSLTDAGRAEAASGPGEPWQEVASEVPPALVELRNLSQGVRAATRQVVHAGSEKQISAAADLLRETRRKLYQLLAEDEPAN
ncbi:MAG: PadR family transcriptional regulator [Gaiellales bacterium]